MLHSNRNANGLSRFPTGVGGREVPISRSLYILSARFGNMFSDLAGINATDPHYDCNVIEQCGEESSKDRQGGMAARKMSGYLKACWR